MFKVGDEVRCPTMKALGEDQISTTIGKVGIVSSIQVAPFNSKTTVYVKWANRHLFHYEDELTHARPTPKFVIGNLVVYTGFQYLPSVLGVGKILEIHGALRDYKVVYKVDFPGYSNPLYPTEAEIELAPEPEPEDPRLYSTIPTGFYVTQDQRVLVHEISKDVLSRTSHLNDQDRSEVLFMLIQDITADAHVFRRGALIELGGKPL